MTKLLITGAWNQFKEYREQIEQMGYEIRFVQYEKDELPKDVYNAEVIICNGLFQHHNIEKFVNLKVIQLTSAGYDRVPMDYIKENDIKIYNAKDVYSKPMAEFALCGVLQLYKQSRFFIENQKKHQWVKHRGLYELTEKTVCIIGCGNVGSTCAKYFSAFDCKVIGVARSERIGEHFSKIVSLEQLDDVLEVADVVILAIPANEDTFHVIDKQRLSLLKKTAIIVNIARGSVMDTEALIEVLPNIGGAVLDVFEEEPVSENNRLWDLENVIMTPHNSFVGEKNGERLGKIILNNIRIINK